VIAVADARCTSTSHSICGAPGAGVVGTTVHTTFQSGGHEWVNHRPLAFAATVPVNCTPTRMALLLFSVGSSVWEFAHSATMA
jgi:hypothetical protein